MSLSSSASVVFWPFELVRHELVDQRVARFLTTSAVFGAESTMLQSCCVNFALGSAAFGDCRACLQLRADDFINRRGAAQKDSTGCRADVGAIEVEANTPRQVQDAGFREASIGACGAGLRAGETGADTFLQGRCD